jgi:hypothetical protein
MDSMYIFDSSSPYGRVAVIFSKDEVAGVLECLDGYGPGEGVLGDLNDEIKKWE